MFTQILTDAQIRRRLTRLAYQLCEANYGTDALHLVGIAGGGDRLAVLLQAELATVQPALRVQVSSLALHKEAPLEAAPTLEPSADTLAGQIVILIDDVLNSGRTLAYALADVLRRAPARVQTLLLVDRHHPAFPVAATFAGLSLSTTLAEHVTVALPEAGEFGAWLSWATE